MRHVIVLLCLFSALGLVGITGNCTEEKPWHEQVPVIPRAGGVLAPASPQESIRMDSMEINILAQTGSYEVDAVFRLFNTGEATCEWIGFPKHCRVSPYILLSHPKPVIHDFIRFEGWVNGRKALFMERRSFLSGNRDAFPKPAIAESRLETRWMAKKIVFPKHASTTVRIKYEAPYYACKTCNLSGETGFFYLGPGHYWKGNIAKAEIVLENPNWDDYHRGMALWEPGTAFCKKTITKTTKKIELEQLAPLAKGWLFAVMCG